MDELFDRLGDIFTHIDSLNNSLYISKKGEENICS